MDIGILVSQLILVGLFSGWCTIVFDAIYEAIKSAKEDNL